MKLIYVWEQKGYIPKHWQMSTPPGFGIFLAIGAASGLRNKPQGARRKKTRDHLLRHILELLSGLFKVEMNLFGFHLAGFSNLQIDHADVFRHAVRHRVVLRSA